MKLLLTISAALIVAQGSAVAQSEVGQAFAHKKASALQAGRYDEARIWGIQEVHRAVTVEQVPDFTPQQAFAILEADRMAERSPTQAFSDLPGLAIAAFAVGDLAKAETYAQQALDESPQFPHYYDAGAAVYYGNEVLGRILLRKGDIAGAKARLFASALSKGTPVLKSFGPNLLLARELLQAGERDTVLAFLEQLRNGFWNFRAQKIESWEAAIQAGQMPDFGFNLGI